MLLRLLTIIICFLALSHEQFAYSLVGVEGNTQSPNLPKNNKKSVKNNTKNKKDMSENEVVTTDMLNFPNDDEEEYKMLFDDGFANIVDDSFQTGEEWDVFVNQSDNNEINRKYIAGNSDDYTQMDAIEAEKKTIIDQSLVNKDNISTYRTRIMAYVSLDQMIFDDLFRTAPYGYYVDAIAN